MTGDEREEKKRLERSRKRRHYSFWIELKVPFLKETLYGKQVQVADREFVESDAILKILGPASTRNVAFLVIGEPFGFFLFFFCNFLQFVLYLLDSFAMKKIYFFVLCITSILLFF